MKLFNFTRLKFQAHKNIVRHPFRLIDIVCPEWNKTVGINELHKALLYSNWGSLTRLRIVKWLECIAVKCIVTYQHTLSGACNPEDKFSHRRNQFGPR